MKLTKSKQEIYATLLALPFIGFWYYLLNPPQCPLDYTQEQINSSHCIIGANIGGIPIFICASIATWFVFAWLVNKLATKKTHNKSM